MLASREVEVGEAAEVEPMSVVDIRVAEAGGGSVDRVVSAAAGMA